MPLYVQNANLLLAMLTLLGQGIIALVLLLLVFGKKEILRKYVSRHAICYSFIVTLVALFGSLFYSDIAGFEPCKLCWYQRIFMYPQVILLGLALWTKDQRVGKYALGLSIPGILVSSYHYMMQRGVVSGTCDVVGQSPTCSKQFVIEFGYITIPIMAWTAFAMIIVFFVLSRVQSR